mmetsp:Transcript_134304/g.246910  ORF Transcript_134304/g.246910 Transcript_134304/m.246910 type:complete len:137 (-) Transcript_134304:32-442(-)
MRAQASSCEMTLCDAGALLKVPPGDATWKQAAFRDLVTGLVSSVRLKPVFGQWPPVKALVRAPERFGEVKSVPEKLGKANRMKLQQVRPCRATSCMALGLHPPPPPHLHLRQRAQCLRGSPAALSLNLLSARQPPH